MDKERVLETALSQIHIVFGKGISRSGGILDMAIELGLADKSGPWLTYGGTRIGQGRENAKRFLEDNPDVATELDGRIRARSVGAGMPLTFESAEAKTPTLAA